MALTAQPKPQGKLLDYEQFIDHQLNLTRSKIRIIDVLTALVTLAACVLGVLFLEVILDHAFGLPAWVRGIVLTVGLTLSGAYAAWRIIWPLVRRVNSYYAAKTIESLDPHFKNSLITYLDLRKQREGTPKTFLAAVESKAVNDLAELEIDSVVDQRPLVKMTYALAAVVVLFCLYSLLTPKSILDSARRAFLSDIARPTNTQLVNIKPGDDASLATVAAGTDIEISAEVRGKRPQAISLHYSLDGGQFFARQELGRGPSDYDPWITTLRNVQPRQGFHKVLYYLTGGDAETRTYTLTVKPTPMVLEVSHDLRFPGYIEKERLKAGQPKGLEALDGGSVEAIQGTIVTVHARTNEPAHSARLEFGKNSATARKKTRWRWTSTGPIPTSSLASSSSRTTAPTGSSSSRKTASATANRSSTTSGHCPIAPQPPSSFAPTLSSRSLPTASSPSA